MDVKRSGHRQRQAQATKRQVAADLQAIAGNRERAFRRHVAAIEGDLAPGLDVDDGVASYLALVLPEIYRTLVVERGWSAQRYEQLLATALVRQLLGR